MGLRREFMLLVTSEDVEGGAGQQVVLWIQVNRLSPNAIISDGAVDWYRWVGRGVSDSDSELEVQRQGEPDHIKPRAWVSSEGRK